MRPTARTQWRTDPRFTRIATGRRVLVVNSELLRSAAEILVRLGELSSSSAKGAGNRASATRVTLSNGGEIVARRSRRGGLARLVSSDTYLGIRPRPLRELAIAAEAHRRGIAVAEPLGAMVEWLAPAIYRGFFLTRAINGMTLWEFIRHDDDPVVRGHVLLRAREAVATMHNLGLFHADLNMHNLFVTQRGESFEVIVLDLDQGRLYQGALAATLRRSNAARLLRSARKLDPEGRWLDSAALKTLDVS